MSKSYADYVKKIAEEIAEEILRKDAEYGGSWIARGGVGAYMMKVRKSDRLETQVRPRGYDILRAIEETKEGRETVEDTLLDDAAYAILILAEARARKEARSLKLSMEPVVINTVTGLTAKKV